MPGYILDVNSTLMCPHAGQFSIITSNSRVKLGGQPAVTQQDTYTISGCPFTTNAGPQPCVLAKWIVVATRVKIGGNFAVLKDSTALCQAANQAPQGPPNIVVTQMKVKGT
ncbi:MAG: DUF4280 domain-containing protein [Nitrososphaerota archaeon]|jgi:uncharacterized Zn-binding protein involved in type VI secretion|nr:DUF4280 domain-containing protein [Nitrososphaerota archaeon]